MKIPMDVFKDRIYDLGGKYGLGPLVEQDYSKGNRDRIEHVHSELSSIDSIYQTARGLGIGQTTPYTTAVLSGIVNQRAGRLKCELHPAFDIGYLKKVFMGVAANNGCEAEMAKQLDQLPPTLLKNKAELPVSFFEYRIGQLLHSLQGRSPVRGTKLPEVKKYSEYSRDALEIMHTELAALLDLDRYAGEIHRIAEFRKNLSILFSGLKEGVFIRQRGTSRRLIHVRHEDRRRIEDDITDTVEGSEDILNLYRGSDDGDQRVMNIRSGSGGIAGTDKSFDQDYVESEPVSESIQYEVDNRFRRLIFYYEWNNGIPPRGEFHSWIYRNRQRDEI